MSGSVLIRELEHYRDLPEKNLMRMKTEMLALVRKMSKDTDSSGLDPLDEAEPTIETIRYYFNQFAKAAAFAQSNVKNESMPYCLMLVEIYSDFLITAPRFLNSSALIISPREVLAWGRHKDFPIIMTSSTLLPGTNCGVLPYPYQEEFLPENKRENIVFSNQDIGPLNVAVACYHFAGGKEPQEFLKTAITHLKSTGAYQTDSNQWIVAKGQNLAQFL